jgi:hypothetical protein
MKLVFLGSSSAIVYYMRYHRIIKLTYDKEQDTFKYLLLVAPSAVLALLTSHVYTVLEVCSLQICRTQHSSVVVHDTEQQHGTACFRSCRCSSVGWQQGQRQ